MKIRRVTPGDYHRRAARAEFNIKTRADGKTIVEGYASVFGSRNSYDEIFQKGAFKRSLEDLESGNGPTIIHLLHHDERTALGIPKLAEDDKGLHFETSPMSTDIARNAIVEIEEGALSGVSVGFSYRQGGARWIEEPEDGSASFLEITGARLFEISSVRWGSDPEALGGIAERSAFARRLERACSCNESEDDADEKRGAELGAIIDEAVEAMVDDDMPREDVIADLADAADVEPETINQIISGDVDCPPLERLEAIADYLGLSVDALVAAAEADGCMFGDDEDEGDEEVEGDQDRSLLAQLVARRYDLTTPRAERDAIDALLMQITQRSATTSRVVRSHRSNNLSEIEALEALATEIKGF